MPRKRQNKNNNRNKKRGTRARGFNKRNGNSNMNRINLRSTIVPDRTQVILKVSSLVTFPFTSTSFYATYKGNDLVNPGNSTWVNQPAGFIDWMSYYQYFRVIRSSIKMQVVNDGDDVRNRGLWICIYPTLESDSSLVAGGYVNAMTQSYARGKFVGSPTGQDKVVCSNGIGTTKFIGYNVNNDTDFLGTVDTPPARQWYWGIACSGLSDGGTEFAILTAVVTIYYQVQFIQRKPISMTFPGLTTEQSLAAMEIPYQHNQLKFEILSSN